MFPKKRGLIRAIFPGKYGNLGIWQNQTLRWQLGPPIISRIHPVKENNCMEKNLPMNSKCRSWIHGYILMGITTCYIKQIFPVEKNHILWNHWCYSILFQFNHKIAWPVFPSPENNSPNQPNSSLSFGKNGVLEAFIRAFLIASLVCSKRWKKNTGRAFGMAWL